jgi:hypothetical protein
MAVQVVNQDSVLELALKQARQAERRIWLTSPWVTAQAVNLLLQDALPRAGSGKLDIRLVYRVKEPADLEITDLESLKALEDAGCKVRYSTRLHAKLVLVDCRSAIVSSSNLTATAGYSLGGPAPWRNEELGVLVEGDPAVLADLEGQFLSIWESASCIEPGTVGIAMDLPTVEGFSFVAIADVPLGQYVTTATRAGELAVGRVAELTAYNRSFPRMDQTTWLAQGYGGGRGQGGATQVPDLLSLFSQPSKERGFLVTKTFFEPECVFHIARVEVLKHFRDGRPVAPSVPAVPGADVSLASAEVLNALLGEGDIALGTVMHHPEVQVRLQGREVVSKHLAVLGMTGSGKSNATKVLLRALLRSPAHGDLRVVIVDTHGEYVEVAAELAPSPVLLDVEFRKSILDEAVVKELLGLSRTDPALAQKLQELADGLPEGSGLEQFLALLGSPPPPEDALAEKLRRLGERARQRDDLCLWPKDAARLGADGRDEDLKCPGLYVLDLRRTLDMEARSAKVAALLRYVFQLNKETLGEYPALVVVDEAQNYAPEQQTGWLKRTRDSSDAIFAIASEGRKFSTGLLVSTQRPARVNKDILSQCNTHMVFRVANVEDLDAIAGSFEAASRKLLDELPGLDTGVCVVGGTAIGMVVPTEVPLFEATAGGAGD